MAVSAGALSLGLYDRIPFVITAGQSLSNPMVMGGVSVVAIDIPNPNAWVTANLTFQAATDVGALGGVPGETDPTLASYNSIFDKGGTEFTVTVGALTTGVGNGRYITLSGGTAAVGSTNLDGVKYMKIRSGTAGTPVVQTSTQTIYLVVKTLY